MKKAKQEHLELSSKVDEAITKKSLPEVYSLLPDSGEEINVYCSEQKQLPEHIRLRISIRDKYMSRIIELWLDTMRELLLTTRRKQALEEYDRFKRFHPSVQEPEIFLHLLYNRNLFNKGVKVLSMLNELFFDQANEYEKDSNERSMMLLWCEEFLYALLFSYYGAVSDSFLAKAVDFYLNVLSTCGKEELRLSELKELKNLYCSGMPRERRDRHSTLKYIDMTIEMLTPLQPKIPLVRDESSELTSIPRELEKFWQDKEGNICAQFSKQEAKVLFPFHPRRKKPVQRWQIAQQICMFGEQKIDSSDIAECLRIALKQAKNRLRAFANDFREQCRRKFGEDNADWNKVIRTSHDKLIINVKKMPYSECLNICRKCKSKIGFEHDRVGRCPYCDIPLNEPTIPIGRRAPAGSLDFEKAKPEK